MITNCISLKATKPYQTLLSILYIKAGLWRKRIENGFNGKCFDFIYNMYKDIKQKITTSEGSTNFFSCNIGVRQGENLSPFLFSIFLNDLEDYLKAKQASGVNSEVNTDDAYISIFNYWLLCRLPMLSKS